MKLHSKVALAFIAWTAIGVLYGLQLYSASKLSGPAVTLTNALTWQLIEWYAWALLAPGIFYLVRKFYPSGDFLSIIEALGAHATAAAICVLVQPFLVAVFYEFLPWANPERGSFLDIYSFTLRTHFGFLALTYAKILAVALVFDFWHRYQEGQIRSAQLEHEVTAARLHALQMQLQPHFLFNTLNAIASLVRANPSQAERMISRLGDLLRAALNRSDRLEVPLREEVEFTQRYLDIESVRFGDRLSTHLEIDPSVADALVPNLLLQPLVENSIRHGISRVTGPGEISLQARAEGDRLVLEVADNGAGPGGPVKGSGVGLENTRSRLAQLYGDDQALLRIGARPGGGTLVTIRLPLHRAPASGSAAPATESAAWTGAAAVPHSRA